MPHFLVFVDGAEQAGKHGRYQARQIAYGLWDKSPQGTIVSVCGVDETPSTWTGFWREGYFNNLGQWRE